MLYYLTQYLDALYDLPGFGVFQYQTFRAILAAITSLIISGFVGKWLIRYLQRKQIGERIRDLGPESHKLKAGTPTMGGLIILCAVAIPCLLWGKLHNMYLVVSLAGLLWMGAIGFLDDYIKVFRKDKKGLKGKFKVFGQVMLGLLVGLALTLHPDFQGSSSEFATTTNVPFFKFYEFDYAQLAFWTDGDDPFWGRLVYILVTIFIVTAVSNGVNLTDGLDGLAAGTTAIVAAALGVFAYISGNVIFSDYLNITYIPDGGELFIFSAALIGGCIGFLWFNAFPAQVFMGDTGSLALGGAVGVLAMMVKKELLLPLVCGIFFIESLSVILQVGWFKYTKKKYGEGRRIFRMAPLHHHFEKAGMHEVKIVVRFWIITLLLELLAFATLKLR